MVLIRSEFLFLTTDTCTCVFSVLKINLWEISRIVIYLYNRIIFRTLGKNKRLCAQKNRYIFLSIFVTVAGKIYRTLKSFFLQLYRVLFIENILPSSIIFGNLFPMQNVLQLVHSQFLFRRK